MTQLVQILKLNSASPLLMRTEKLWRNLASIVITVISRIGREIKSKELASLKNFLVAQREHLQGDREEALKIQKVGLALAPKDLETIELGAWTSVCRVILNLHEVLTIY